MEKTGGLILCGGKSSRMGFDKGSLRFEGETLLQRVLGRMRQVASPVVVCFAATSPSPRLPPDVLVARDEEPGRGPLWGLLEGFRALAGRAEQVLVLPVDMPFFTVDWIRRLEAGLEGQRACLCQWEGYVNALTAAYRMDLLPKLDALVTDGRMRPVFLAQDEPSRIIVVEDHWREGEGPPPMMDVDTPEAYRGALLMEGIGDPQGVPVTIEWPGSGAAEHAEMPPPSLPLFAASTLDALRWAAQLYPELQLPLERAGQPGAVRVTDQHGRVQPMEGRAALEAGMRIAVDIGKSVVGREV